MLKTGEFLERLLKVITGMKASILSGRLMGPIKIMARVEKTFVKMGKLQALKNSCLVKNNIYGPMTTSLVNHWEFFRRPNREPNKAQIMVGHFTSAAVTRQKPCASQLLKEPQTVRPPESISQAP